jgi:RimJ/RimL family protein N-acetyltransferase
LLEGKNVNLRIVEKEDLQLWGDWNNNIEFFGDFIWFPQNSRTELAKRYDNLNPDSKWFFIEKKDGTKIGGIIHFLAGNLLEIGYALVSNERGKGYCSEAVKIMVDYLFLSRDLVRIQATTDVNNLVSQRVLEKAGFQKEGIIRKSAFFRGKWRDGCLFSILREEWKEPKILTRTEK